MALVRRLLTVTFKLGEGAFGESGTDEIKLSGLRVSADVAKGGGASMSTLSMQVFGMKLSSMNKLSTLGMIPTATRRNTVTVEAGDDSSGMGTVFIGTINNAWFDGQAAPAVAFNVEAQSGLLEAVSHAKPTSIKGSGDVATIMAGLARQMNLTFENNGVTTKLANSYYYGSPREQAKAVADDAGIEWVIDNGKLAIWRPGQTRGSTSVLVSPETGLQLYPTFTKNGVAARVLFNPNISFGGKIEIKSVITPANGQWVIYSLDHKLQSLFPGGSWYSNFAAARVGFGPIVS